MQFTPPSIEAKRHLLQFQRSWAIQPGVNSSIGLRSEEAMELEREKYKIANHYAWEQARL